MIYLIYFTIPHCQPADRRYVVGDHLRRIKKERGQNERMREGKKRKLEINKGKRSVLFN